MKNFLTITSSIFVLLFSSQAGAAKNCISGAEIQVNGLVCDFCARALEKVFSERNEVENINVNLDEGLVDVNYNTEKTIDDTTLTKLITDSGYNVVQINQRNCE